MSSAVRVVVLGSILVLCALTATARAEGSHVRAAVLVSSAEDRALTERLRGQTSDLDAEIVVRDARSIAPTLEARMREASALAQTERAMAVFWFRVAGSSVVVYAAVPAQDRVLVRPVAIRSEKRGAAGKLSSATLEATALIVRDVIRALGQGATVGELRERRSDDEDGPQLALDACADARCIGSVAPLSLAASSEAREAREAPSFVASVGWQATRARDAPSLMNSLDLRMGARYGGVSAALALTLGAIDVERVTERADLLVRRHSLALATAMTWPFGDLSVGLGLVAGASMFMRATRSLSPAFTPTATQHHVRPFVGPEVRAAYTLTSSLAVFVTVGLDVVLNAPRFEVAEVPGRSSVYGLAVVQPRLGLGIEWPSAKPR